MSMEEFEMICPFTRQPCLKNECALWEEWTVLDGDGVEEEGWCILRNFRYLREIGGRDERT